MSAADFFANPRRSEPMMALEMRDASGWAIPSPVLLMVGAGMVAATVAMLSGVDIGVALAAML